MFPSPAANISTGERGKIYPSIAGPILLPPPKSPMRGWLEASSFSGGMSRSLAAVSAVAPSGSSMPIWRAISTPVDSAEESVSPCGRRRGRSEGTPLSMMAL